MVVSVGDETDRNSSKAAGILVWLSGVMVALVAVVFIALAPGRVDSIWLPAALMGVAAAAVPSKWVRVVAYALVSLVLVPAALYFGFGVYVGLVDPLGNGSGADGRLVLETALLAVGAAAGATGVMSTLRRG